MQIDSQALPAHGINPRINTALRSLPLAINTAWGSIPRLNQNPNLLKQIKNTVFNLLQQVCDGQPGIDPQAECK